jgi:hypothetical protein
MRIILAVLVCVLAPSAHADHWTGKVAQTRYAVDACLSSLANTFPGEPSHRPLVTTCTNRMKTHARALRCRSWEQAGRPEHKGKNCST